MPSVCGLYQVRLHSAGMKAASLQRSVEPERCADLEAFWPRGCAKTMANCEHSPHDTAGFSAGGYVGIAVNRVPFGSCNLWCPRTSRQSDTDASPGTRGPVSLHRFPHGAPMPNRSVETDTQLHGAASRAGERTPRGAMQLRAAHLQR